jgi:hypothetical protein
MRFLTSGFLHQTTPFGPLTCLFAYGFVFAEIFDYEINFFVVSGVNDTAHHWSAVSMTLPTTGQRCQWYRWPLINCRKQCCGAASSISYGSASGSSLTPLTAKKFPSQYLREKQAVCKKVLTCRSGSQMELFDEKNQRSKISWQGPFMSQVYKLVDKVPYKISNSKKVWNISFAPIGSRRKSLCYLTPQVSKRGT